MLAALCGQLCRCSPLSHWGGARSVALQRKPQYLITENQRAYNQYATLKLYKQYLVKWLVWQKKDDRACEVSAGVQLLVADFHVFLLMVLQSWSSYHPGDGRSSYTPFVSSSDKSTGKRTSTRFTVVRLFLAKDTLVTWQRSFVQLSVWQIQWQDGRVPFPALSFRPLHEIKSFCWLFSWPHVYSYSLGFWTLWSGLCVGACSVYLRVDCLLLEEQMTKDKKNIAILFVN